MTSMFGVRFDINSSTTKKSFLLQVGWTLAAWGFWVSRLQVKVYSLKSNNYIPIEIILNVIISAKTVCAQIPTQLLGHRVPKKNSYYSHTSVKILYSLEKTTKFTSH